MPVVKSQSSLLDRISSSFRELTDSAARLNSVSDELANAIRPIDTALKTLNLGISAWHSYFKSPEDEPSGEYWSRRIGYARVGTKWGLALATVSGNYNADDENGEEWLFNDAPRWMRVEAVDHIPALLDLLIKQTNKAAEILQQKTERVRELADTISALSEPSEAKAKR